MTNFQNFRQENAKDNSFSIFASLRLRNSHRCDDPLNASLLFDPPVNTDIGNYQTF